MHSVSAACPQPAPLATLGLGAAGGPGRCAGRSLLAASSGPAATPDNSSPTGTSGHFHMELLLQGVAATGGSSARAEPAPSGPGPGLFIGAPYRAGPTPPSEVQAQPSSAHRAGSGPALRSAAAFAPLTPTPSAQVPRFLVSFLTSPLPTLPAAATGQRGEGSPNAPIPQEGPVGRRQTQRRAGAGEAGTGGE